MVGSLRNYCIRDFIFSIKNHTSCPFQENALILIVSVILKNLNLFWKLILNCGNQRNVSLFSSVRSIHWIKNGFESLVKGDPVVGVNWVRSLTFAIILDHCYLNMVIPQVLHKRVKLMNGFLVYLLLALIGWCLINIVWGCLGIGVETKWSYHDQMRRKSCLFILPSKGLLI